MPGRATLAAAGAAPLAPAGPRSGLPLFVALGTVVLAFIRFGYAYGVGDQDELIPSVLHLLDGNLFRQDWAIQTVTDGVTVRSYFLWLIAAPSALFPVWLATAALWLVTGIAVGYAVYYVAYELLHDRLAAAIAVPLALAVTVRWTIGANALHYPFLAPEGVAWAVSLLGVAAFLRGRLIPAGVLMGIGAWFHLLAGLHPALLLGLWVVVGAAGRERPLRDVFVFGVAFTVAALPILIPVGIDHLAAATADPAGPSPLYVHAYFRNPFHHLLSATPAGQLLRFALVAVPGALAGLWLARRGGLQHARLLGVTAGLAILLILAGALLVEVAHSSLAAKLQFQKPTLLLVLGAAICISGAVVRAVPPRWRQWGLRMLEMRRTGLALVVVLMVAIGSLSAGGWILGDRMQPLRHQETPLAEAERWAREHTRVDALFAIPPSVSTFRTTARRSVVANFAAFVFTDEAMQAWYNRLLAVAPIDRPPAGFGLPPVLDAAYHAHDADSWEELREQFGIDFALVRRPLDLPFQIVFENPGWRIYALTAPAGS